MNVYDVNTPYSYSQVHSVVAPNMSIAESVFKAKYPFTKILSITLHSEYVEIAPQERVEATNTASNTQSHAISLCIGCDRENCPQRSELKSCPVTIKDKPNN